MSTPDLLPLALYFVFHPDCEASRNLAEGMYRELRLGFLSGDSGSPSTPTWIRASLDEKGVLAPPIRFELAERNLIVLLCSHRLVEDAEWVRAVLKLHETIPTTPGDKTRPISTEADASGRDIHGLNQLLPVAVEDSFYRLGPIYQDRNPVRLFHLMSRDGGTLRETERAQAALRRSILEHLAHTILFEKATHARDLRVFLSHAKRDGTKIASQLRDGIRQFAQMIPWYDENDLPWAHTYENLLTKNAQSMTAGMIAVVTDAYPSRPWCRREIGLARQPCRLGEPTDSTGKVWTVQPVVAVMAPDSNWNTGLAALERVPRIGWSQDAPVERVERIVDRLVLEMMTQYVNRAIAEKLSADHTGNDACFLTWVPDTWSLAELAKHLDNRQEIRWIVYPGVGLSPSEHEGLKTQLRLFHQDTQLKSFREWKARVAEGKNAAGPGQPFDKLPAEGGPGRLSIALSAGGLNEELAHAGLLLEHVNEAMIRLVMRGMELGHRIVFGGSLNSSEASLTNSMFDAALRWIEIAKDPIESSRVSAVDLQQPKKWPLANYSAYPYCNHFQPGQRANLLGVCEVIEVVPRALQDPSRKQDRAKRRNQIEERPDLRKLMGDALTEMRQKSTFETDARIVFGGRSTEGKSGKRPSSWMPGILEEVGCSLAKGLTGAPHAAPQPVLIIGALGGCAGQIAGFLRDQSQEWPKELSLDSCADSRREYHLTDTERLGLTQRFQQYQQLLEQYRRQLFDSNSPQVNGISRTLLLEALEPELSLEAVLQLVDRFLNEVQRRQQPMPTVSATG